MEQTMTDAQLITISAAFLAAAIAVLFNNSRIGDLRTDMNVRITDLRDSINRHIDDKHAMLDSKLDHIIEMLATHHDRITKLE
jgi:hypothetical protein